MEKRLAILLLTAGISAASNAVAAPAFLEDGFDAPALDSKFWYIPTHDPKGDGTFVGRTQFRATQDSPPPAPLGGHVCLPLQTYSPNGHSFYGAEIISKQEFTAGAGLHIIVRAKMNSAKHPGIVGGIFLYALNPGSDTLHDEIDFELLTNVPRRAQTNIYGNEALGIGHSQLIPFRAGSIADTHTYEIKWTQSQVSWLIDGALVRTETKHIPTRPMAFYLNNWAPDPGWPEGYSAKIQPAKSKRANKVLDALCVDSVIIKPLAP